MSSPANPAEAGHGASAGPAATDRLIVARIWPLLAAAALSLFPFTIFATLLVPIAASAEADEATVGGLRGLGGVAALLAGVTLAPMLGRWARSWAPSLSLLALAAASGWATLGTLPALVGFCLGVGLCTAVLTPMLLTRAADSFTTQGDSGRAATLVTAVQSLAAVAAGPVIGGLAILGGWRGALWATAGACALLAAILLLWQRPRRGQPEEAVAAPRYLETFSRLRRHADLLALIGVSALRTTAFMGQLAFLAVVYARHFGMSAETFTLVWTLSGASFFLGNYLAGRWARRVTRHPGAALLLIGVGALGGAAALPLVTLPGNLAAALAGTAVISLSHAVIAAQVTTMIAHRGREQTATAFSLNAAGQSVGVFAGAALGGAGLAWAGMPGLTLALSLPMVAVLSLLPLLRR